MAACKGKTRKGAKCKAPALKGKKHCSAHAPDLPDSARFGSPVQAREAGQLGGRPPLPKPTDVARQLVEENVHRVLRPHFKALGLDIQEDGTVVSLDHGAILTGESKEGVVVASEIEDLGAQIAAAERLLDRIYGKPKQQTEVSGVDGGPITFADLAGSVAA